MNLIMSNFNANLDTRKRTDILTRYGLMNKNDRDNGLLGCFQQNEMVVIHEKMWLLEDRNPEKIVGK